MKLLGLLLFTLCLSDNLVLACTTVIVGKKATLDGSIIIARNSDTRSPSRAKHLKIYPPQGAQEVRFLGLPYHDTEAVNGMLQVATNDNGVAISATETIESNTQTLKVDPYLATGVEEANVTEPVMRVAKTARHAVELIGKRIEAEGTAEGFGIAVADKDEVWYLENASGHHWAAVRVPEETYLIAANQGRLQEIKFKPTGEYEDGYLGSSDLVQFAKQNGLYQERNGAFDFRLSFQSITHVETNGFLSDIHSNYLRIASVLELFSGYSLAGFEQGSFPTFVRPSHKLSVGDVAKALSSFYEGMEQDPYSKPGVPQIYRAISVFNASNSHITVVRDLGEENLSIANIEYIALGMPTLSLYVPFYSGIREVPHAYKIGNENADDDSAFWKFRKLQTLAFQDFARNQPILDAAFQELSKSISERQTRMEDEFKTNHNPQVIQSFTDSIVKESLDKVDQLRLELESYYSSNSGMSVESNRFDNSYYDLLTRQIFRKYAYTGKRP